MNLALTLNPLMVADVVREHDEPVAMNLRCFARRRSFKPILVDRSVEPQLFGILLDWFDGKHSSETPELDHDYKLRLWRKGLLISPDEGEAVPRRARPDLTDGHRIAAALCPAVADLLHYGPSLPPTPLAPDNDFIAAGYCNLPPMLAPADLAALNAFYDTLRDGEWLELSERDSNRLVIHNDPAARRIHHALTPFLAALTGQDLKPSYSFASEYRCESPLPRHTDRDQCEVTVSLYLDYRPEPESDICPWPLVVHTPEGDIPIHQYRGGGPLILGRVLPHSRSPLPPGHKARMVFLHYVLASFSGRLD